MLFITGLFIAEDKFFSISIDFLSHILYNNCKRLQL